MGNWLKDLVVTLGIALGLVQAQTDPALLCKITRTREAVYAAAVLENSMNEDMDTLIHAGNPMTVRFVYTVGSEISGEYVHTIIYSPKEKLYSVSYSETGRVHETSSTEAAYSIFLGFYSLFLCTVEDFSEIPDKKIRIQSILELPEDNFFDPGVLWNYQTPEWDIEYSKITEIPY